MSRTRALLIATLTLAWPALASAQMPQQQPMAAAPGAGIAQAVSPATQPAMAPAPATPMGYQPLAAPPPNLRPPLGAGAPPGSALPDGIKAAR